MTLYLCYNNDHINLYESLNKKCDELKLEFVAYNEDEFKTRRKAFMLKAGWSAKKTPFCILKNNKQGVKTWYTEADECNYDNIINYLNDKKIQ